MIVAWKDGQPELRYSLKREFAKGMHDKEAQRCILGRDSQIAIVSLTDVWIIGQPIFFMNSCRINRLLFSLWCSFLRSAWLPGRSRDTIPLKTSWLCSRPRTSSIGL